MKETDIWEKAGGYDFKESEIKVCGSDVRLTSQEETIEGYELKYRLSCIDQDFKAFNLYLYEKNENHNSTQ